MKKKVIKILFIFVILFFPCFVFAYTDGDEPVTSTKIYNLLTDDINSEDIIKLYNPNNTEIPSYFNLNDYFYNNYGFHIPVANQKNLGLCDTFSSLKSIETNYALKNGKYIDTSERYFDYMTTSDFLGNRDTGFLCENNVCNEGDASSAQEVFAVAQTFGAPLEKELPYVNYTENDYALFNNAHSILKLNGAVSFANMQDLDNKEEWIKIIKIHLMKYGSLRAAVCAPRSDIYDSNKASAYQYSTCQNGGHGVSIVGWDDNYSKDNFKIPPKHDGAFIVLNSWGTSWGSNGYYYVSYEDNSIYTQLYGALDVTETKKYNVYSKSANMFDVAGGYGFGAYSTEYIYKAMKFDRVNETEYISHISISASDAMANNTSTKIKFYLNPIDDTFDKEKLIYLGEELPSLSQSDVTILTLDEPIKITGKKFALVFEITGDVSNFGFRKALDKNNNPVSRISYSSKGFDKPWSLETYPIFPVFVFTTGEKVKSASIKTEPSKKTYSKGQAIDLTGGVLNVTYEDNIITEVNMEDPKVKVYDYNTDSIGTKRVTLLFEGEFLTYNISVYDVDRIEVKSVPAKITYVKGEELNLTGGMINIIYSNDNVEEIPMTDKEVTVSGYKKNNVGEQELTVTYKNKTTKFNVTVLDSTFVVQFDTDGGSHVDWQIVNYNALVTKPSDPTKIGYTFKEWQLNGSTYNFNTPVTSDIVLVAVWVKLVTPQEPSLKDLLQNKGYTVNGNFVSFTIGETIESIKSKLTGVTIETQNTIISTGTVIKLGNESYTAVVKGDLNGDCKANSGDLLQMRKFLLEETNLNGAYKQAGIIESKNEIKSLDLLRLRQYLLGEYEFK